MQPPAQPAAASERERNARRSSPCLPSVHVDRRIGVRFATGQFDVVEQVAGVSLPFGQQLDSVILIVVGVYPIEKRAKGAFESFPANTVLQ